jgi:predicted DNA-binding transcriptional regulator AlpA
LLGLNSKTITDAQLELQPPMDLTHLLHTYPELDEAWKRGRLLHQVRAWAATPTSIADASKKLQPPQDLQRLISSDREVADIWYQSRHDAAIGLKNRLMRVALDGNQAAIRAIEPFLAEHRPLREADASSGVRLDHLAVAELAQIMGKSRQTIYDWVRKHGLPRQEDKTFDLPAVLAWWEQYIEARALQNTPAADTPDRVRQLRAERMEMELAREKAQLLDRQEVLAGLIARHQLLVQWARQSIEELARLCQGQKAERIAEILGKAIDELRTQLCQVPAELQLPADAEKKFTEILRELE